MRGPVHAGFTLLAALVFSAAGCTHRTARVNLPAPPAPPTVRETGVASWYGVPYHGRPTASGEIYDMEKLTAAHRSLPFETWVEVTNLGNQKRVTVRITDRGPFTKGRIIDLSHAAARDLDMLGTGTAQVRLNVIEQPPTRLLTNDRYAVQAGAFADRQRAEALRATLEDLFTDARVIGASQNLWRVVAGREMTLDQANDLASRVRQAAGAAIVVPEPGSESPTQSRITPP